MKEFVKRCNLGAAVGRGACERQMARAFGVMLGQVVRSEKYELSQWALWSSAATRQIPYSGCSGLRAGGARCRGVSGAVMVSVHPRFVA
jgi:hypothetical protein